MLIITYGCVTLHYSRYSLLIPPRWYLKSRIFLLSLQLMMLTWCSASFCVFFFFPLYQNQLVDVCEKIQLQALRIEKFIDQTLTAKEQKLQVISPSYPHPFTNYHTGTSVFTQAGCFYCRGRSHMCFADTCWVWHAGSDPYSRNPTIFQQLKNVLTVPSIIITTRSQEVILQPESSQKFVSAGRLLINTSTYLLIEIKPVQ